MKYNTVQQDLENEVWKDIKNYQGKYWISDKGRYKSLQRGKKYYYSLGAIHSKGYRYVNLYKNGIRDQRLIHDLVIEAFKHPLEEGEIVHHKNENKQDNNL